MSTLPDLFAVYGASGCGRGVMPLVRAQLAGQGIGPERAVFVDDAPPAAELAGHRVLEYDAFLAEPAGRRFASIAISDGWVRQRIANRLRKDGILSVSVHAANIVIMDQVQIDEGVILSPFVTLTSNIRIGQFFQANLYSYVEHDCEIGNFVTFAPGVQCNGNVVIEDNVYVGAGAIIKQGRPGQPMRIGRGAVIGMGAVVTRSVDAGTTVAGVPARVLKRAP